MHRRLLGPSDRGATAARPSKIRRKVPQTTRTVKPSPGEAARGPLRYAAQRLPVIRAPPRLDADVRVELRPNAHALTLHGRSCEARVDLSQVRRNPAVAGAGRLPSEVGRARGRTTR
ncbi:MAG TPA: hypothetical protein PLU22_16970 [Polyangiaceae bacterium]|nr:hypothetical protein [Polyangiaceae bacterium]